ncbi:hypothetical protein LTR85_010192 [Meristemomyces frigidus]|nr:hypothetical protein LTR85_010192 [Meristemomyces frigidus]
MSAANLDEVKKKYGFKKVSVATWRDPSGSILPARGGPKSPSISAAAAATPYMPTYKVSYRKPPEPTDDEESEEDEEQKKEDEEQKKDDLAQASQPETAAEAEVQIDSPMEPVADKPSPAPTETAEEATPSADTVEVADGQVIEEPELHEDAQTAAVTTIDAAIEHGDDIVEIVEVPDSGELGVSEGTQEPEDTPSALDDISPRAPSPPPLEESDPAPAEEIDHGNTPTGDPCLSPEAVVAVDEGSNGIPEVVDVDVPAPVPEADDHGDKKVTFAPGTPEPKPTPRKKKSAKGTKNKSKKKVALPVEYLPDDIVAIVDGDGVVEDAQAPESPVTVEAAAPKDSTLDDASPSIVEEKSSTVIEETKAEGDEPTKALRGPASADPGFPVDVPQAEIVPSEEVEETTTDVGDLGPGLASEGDGTEAPAALADSISDPTPPDDIPTAKPSKKKSKSSGKEKDKSRKKSSKNKSKESSHPAAGLGIGLAPPPILDIDDIFDDIPPPPPPPPGFDILNLMPPPPALEEEASPGEIADAETMEFDDAEPQSAVELDQIPATEEFLLVEKAHDPADNEKHSAPEHVEVASVVKSGVDLDEGSTSAPCPDVDKVCEPVDDKDNSGLDKDDDPVDGGEPANDGELVDDGEFVEDSGAVNDGELINDLDIQPATAGDVQQVESPNVAAEEPYDVLPVAEQVEQTDEVPSDPSPETETSTTPEEIAPPPEPESSADILEEIKVHDATTEDGEAPDMPAEPQHAADIRADDSTDEVTPEAEDQHSIGMEEELATHSGPEEAAIGEHAPNDIVLAGAFPSDEAPVESAADRDAVGEDAPGEDAPGEDAPGEDAPGEDAPGESVPGESAPDERTAVVDEIGAQDIAIAEQPRSKNTPADDVDEGEDLLSETPQNQEQPADAIQPDQSASHDVLAGDANVGEDAAIKPEAPENESVGVETEQQEAPPEDGLSVEKDAGNEAAVDDAVQTPLQQEGMSPEESSGDCKQDDQAAGAGSEQAEVSAGEPIQEQPPSEDTGNAAPLPPETSDLVGDEPPADEPGTTDKATEPVQEAPPSPTLSKSSSYKQRADHWERKPSKKQPSGEGKPVEKISSSKRSSRHGRDEPRTRERSSKSRRLSTTAAEEAERRRRREIRKAEDAARLLEETRKKEEEEERTKAHEEELRRIRHEARRAIRKAAAEDAARFIREEAEAVAREEADRRRRREQRARDAETARPRVERRESITKAFLFFGKTSDKARPPNEHRSSHSTRHDDHPSSKRSTSPREPKRQDRTQSKVMTEEELPPKETPKEGEMAADRAVPSSSGGSRPHRRHRERSEGDRPKTNRRDSGRPSRRPVVEEKPRSFFGSLLRGF